MINEQLRVLAVPLNSLTPDPSNARDHDARNMDAIKASLEEYGQQKAIVVNKDGVIIAGNGTWAAAKELGWTEIAAVKYDGKGDGDAFALADNRTGELSRWNHAVLSDKLKSLQEQGFSVERLGWKDYEIAPLLAAEWSAPKPTNETFEPSENQQKEKTKLDLTSDQRITIDRAIAEMRKRVENPTEKEGRCIELICADWLS